MSTKGQYTVSAYRFRDAVNKTGPILSLGRSSKNFSSVENAIKLGVSGLIKNRDGANFAYVQGPDKTHIVTM